VSPGEPLGCKLEGVTPCPPDLKMSCIFLSLISDTKPCRFIFPAHAFSVTPGPRVAATVHRVEQAVPVFENDVSFRRLLLKLKALFEEIDSLLSLCLPPPGIPDVSRLARQVYFSTSNLQALENSSRKLDSFTIDWNSAMHVIAKKQQNRMEQGQEAILAALAICITQKSSEDPSMKLMKRQLKGNLIEEELKESEEPLGSGSFGKVMAGTYYGKKVAIKKALREVMSSEERESFK